MRLLKRNLKDRKRRGGVLWEEERKAKCRYKLKMTGKMEKDKRAGPHNNRKI